MITVAIIHAPRSGERAENVERLLVAIPRATVILDDGHATQRSANRQGCWPIARRAWLAAGAALHHLVIEDDAQLCDGFIDLVDRAVASRPDAAISLFRGMRACSVATVLPTSVIASWLAWAEVAARGIPHHDHLIDQGMKAVGVPHLCTSPSLVEHRKYPSLLGHRHVSACRFDQSPRDFVLIDKEP